MPRRFSALTGILRIYHVLLQGKREIRMEFLQIKSLLEQSWPNWEPVRRIGKGSFGTVYEIQKNNGGKIDRQALKVISIPEDGTALPIGKDRSALQTYYVSIANGMVQEYDTMKELMAQGCTNVVRCDNYVKIPNSNGIGLKLLIKMELLTDLNTYCRKYGFTRQNIIQLGIDICHALEACRNAHVIHRDIKPANLFVSDDGKYKLGDFGVAKQLEQTGYAGSKQGTIMYMAPEVYKNQNYDGRADICSLGLVMYQLLNNGQLPFSDDFEADVQGEALNRRMRGETLPMPESDDGELAKIVCRACESNYKERYADPAEMRMDLERLLDPTDDKIYIFPVKDLEPDIRIRFMCGDQVIEERSYQAGEHLKQPQVEQKIEKDGKRYTFQGWEPALPETATMTMDYRAVYEETITAPKAKKRPNRRPIAAAIAACLVFAVAATALATLKPWEQNKNGSQPQASVDVSTEPDGGDTAAVPSQNVSAEWSDWVEELPADISEEDYEIEDKILYRSREKETTTSSEATMDGWEQYDTSLSTGEYGAWSNWSTTPVAASDTRKVENATQYRYRDLQTTTSANDTLAGWNLVKQTSTWGAYGSWSSWQSSAVSSSDSRQVETKTQYSYRTKTVTQEYTDWGEWSSWQDSGVGEDQYTEVETRSVYLYYWYPCPNCGAHMHGYGFTCPTWAGGCGQATISPDYCVIWGTIPQSEMGFQDWHGTGHTYAYYGNDLVFRDIYHPNESKTQYRYRTRSLKDVISYSNWSSYSDIPVSKSSNTEVRTMTLYRYRDRSLQYTYHFSRWGDWSNWSTTPVSETSSRQVEKQTVYRYADKGQSTVYHFWRWGEWTDFSEEEVNKTENIDVEEKTVYRYREL